MPWQRLSVIVQEEIVEQISLLLSELDAVSVTFQDAGDQPQYEPKPGQIPIWRQTRITALFEVGISLKEIQSLVSNQIGENYLLNWTVDQLEDQIWERIWLDHFQPMCFGKNFWVCPTDYVPPDPGAKFITLDPGLAFGTGTHPTTALCLEWLALHSVKNKSIVDYGCGSGILAVASLMLEAKVAFAVDIDPQALIATQENALKNRVERSMRCCEPKDMTDCKADVVIANILAEPLIDLVLVIKKLVRSGGDLVLSGILKNQAKQIENAYIPFFKIIETDFLEDWARIYAVRR